MREYSAPYLIFALAASLFMVVGGLAQQFMPMQLALILGQAVGMGGVSLFVLTQREPPPQGWFAWRGRAPLSKSTLLLILLIAPALALGSNLLGGLIVSLSPSLQELAQGYMKTTRALLYPEQSWLRAAALCSIVGSAPFFEELLFRQVMLSEQLRAPTPVAVSLIFNGLLFGLLHANPISMLPLTILGVFLAHLTWMTRRLWPAILVHALVNLTNGIIIPELFGAADAASPQGPTSALSLQSLAAVGLVCLLCVTLWTLIARTCSRD